MTDLMVVSFMSGSGGNMVAAVIDNRGYSFTGWDYVLQENDPRIKWRHGCVEWKLQERDGDIPVMDAAFAEIRQTYHSLCSHIMWYHLRYRHNHVFIDCSSSFAANWCKARLIKHIRCFGNFFTPYMLCITNFNIIAIYINIARFAGLTFNSHHIKTCRFKY